MSDNPFTLMHSLDMNPFNDPLQRDKGGWRADPDVDQYKVKVILTTGVHTYVRVDAD